MLSIGGSLVLVEGNWTTTWFHHHTSNPPNHQLDKVQCFDNCSINKSPPHRRPLSKSTRLTFKPPYRQATKSTPSNLHTTIKPPGAPKPSNLRVESLKCVRHVLEATPEQFDLEEMGWLLNYLTSVGSRSRENGEKATGRVNGPGFIFSIS